MSRINALRIINLNYNNNTIKVDDEIFDFASESTLMSLRNGGGKTVLVQMMMAPFVSRRNRDLKDRKFKSYFQNSPTYILTEWQLDDNGGYLLVGMAVKRKSVASDEDSADDLDMFTFIHHYAQKSKYDIYNIPIIEIKKDGQKTVKGYHNLKTELEAARKTLKDPLEIYNMNAFEQSKKYFKKLREYKIDSREWDIIHKINLKESGLSDLFSDAKNVEGLVEKWFLSTVEDKLNKDGNKIKGFNEIVKKYIFQYREIQSKIEKKDTIELFCNELEDLSKYSSDLNEKENDLEDKRNKVANFIKYLNKIKTEKESEADTVIVKIKECDNSINDLKYQELSKDWHYYNDEIDKINNLLNELGETKEKTEEQKSALQKQLHIYECAELKEEYDDNHRELRELESELQNIDKTEEEKTPERNNLGYSLRLYYEKELVKMREKLEKINEKIYELRKSIQKSKVYDETLRNDHTLKVSNKAGLETLIRIYEEEEEIYEQKSGTILTKNILGVFDDGYLEDIENNIGKEIEECEQDIENTIKNIGILNENIELKNREQRNLSRSEVELANDLQKFEEEKSKYENEIKLRKNLLRILNMSSEEIFNKDLITENIENKIQMSETKGNFLAVEKSRLENEKSKLERGILTEIPPKLKEKLDGLDIDFLYGMEWLNKNNRSKEDNQNIIKDNPFLPYALILNEEDIIKIQKNDLKEFTSNPIPIIKKSSIFDEVHSSNNMCSFDNISFYIYFDRRLVDKTELNMIIEEKSNEINRINQKISINNDGKKDYSDKLNKVSETTVTQRLYNESSDKINEAKNKITEVKEKILKNESLIKEFTNKVKEADERYKLYVEKAMNLKGNMEAFMELKKKYYVYCENKTEIAETIKEIADIEIRMGENLDIINQFSEQLNNEEGHLRDTRTGIENTDKEYLKFNQYKKGQLINRDFEVIKSEYDALTSKISGDRARLEKIKESLDSKFKKSQDKLLEKKEEYKLTEPEFINIKYDKFKYKDVKYKFDYICEILENQKREIHSQELERTKLNSYIQNTGKNIYEKFGFDRPKEKDLIMDVNFKSEIILKTREKEKLENSLELLYSQYNKIKENILKLDGYKSLSILDNQDMDIAIDKLDECRNNYINLLEQCSGEVEKCRKNTEKKLDDIASDARLKSEVIVSSSLRTVKDCINVTKSLIEQISIVLNSCRTMVGKLQVDIDYIYKDEEEVISILNEYLKEVHSNLGMIDDNSSVNIEGKSIKMLKIKLPDWDLNKEAYKNSLKFILEKLRDSCLDKLSQNEPIEELISKTVSISYIYNNTVGISNIDVKLYKIEENRQTEISWNNVSTNSGGEGFLSAFVVLSSLLTYMRKDETDIFSNNKDSKVIVMDNPFAQTNAAHLLKPLINIAEKSRTQLICFTGLGGESIYNRFKNIYVLETKQSKLKSNQQYLKFTHEKGDNLVSEIQSSRFKIEEKSIEQMVLF